MTAALRVHAVNGSGPRWTRCHRLAAGLLLTGDPGRVTCKACRALADDPYSNWDEAALAVETVTRFNKEKRS